MRVQGDDDGDYEAHHHDKHKAPNSAHLNLAATCVAATPIPTPTTTASGKLRSGGCGS